MSDCCSEAALDADPRWQPVNGPVLARVLSCRSCGALFVEEWHSRAGHGAALDREWQELTRADEASISRRFQKK